MPHRAIAGVSRTSPQALLSAGMVQALRPHLRAGRLVLSMGHLPRRVSTFAGVRASLSRWAVCPLAAAGRRAGVKAFVCGASFNCVPVCFSPAW